MASNPEYNEFPTDYEMLLKIVLLGDPLVGKSYILSQYMRGDFDLEQKNTIGIEFDNREYTQSPAQQVQLNYKDQGGNIINKQSSQQQQQKIIVQLWDTAGQEKFISVMPSYFRSATGALLVFDVTKQQTFQNCQKWYDLIREMADEHIQVVLVGNKTDLNNLRIVSHHEAQNFANSRNIKYIEVSALESTGIDDAISLVVEDIKSLLASQPNQVETNKSITLRHRVDIAQRNQCCGTGGMV